MINKNNQTFLLFFWQHFPSCNNDIVQYLKCIVLFCENKKIQNHNQKSSSQMVCQKSEVFWILTVSWICFTLSNLPLFLDYLKFQV